MSCHASANLPLAIPNWVEPVEDRTADNAANRGTAKHALLEPIMELSPRDIDGFAKILRYVADLRATRRFKVLVEEGVEAAWLTTKPKTTADLVLFTQDELHVLDSKWGKIPVEVVDNKQLLFYAACYAPLAPKAKGVTVHIMQPYADNFEPWFVDTYTLAAFMAEAQWAEAQIQVGDTTFAPGHHCQFCPANPHSRGLKGKPLCPVMMKLLYPGVVDEDAVLSL